MTDWNAGEATDRAAHDRTFGLGCLVLAALFVAAVAVVVL